MPLYVIRCNLCQNEDTIWRTVDRRDTDIPKCCHDIPMARIISAPFISPDFQEPYVSPASGRVISSRDQQREDLKRNGMILSEPGLKADVARNREALKEKEFAPIAASVDAKVRELVNSGKIES